jgi:hypothetical protein
MEHRKLAGRIPYNPQQQYNPFVSMDITVSVQNLNGILLKHKRDRPGTSEAGLPVTALVSFSKKVASSQTSIASHFPSLPLQPSVQHSNTQRQRLIASWPKDYDDAGNTISTFEFSRMMKKDTVSSNSSGSGPLFLPERVHLLIGLTRGSEIIKLGTTKLVVMGNETQNLQQNLPVSFEDANEMSILRSNSASMFSRKKATKNIKPVSFTNDPNRKYTLDQNACLKVVIKITPSQKKSNIKTTPQRGLHYYGSPRSTGSVVSSTERDYDRGFDRERSSYENIRYNEYDNSALYPQQEPRLEQSRLESNKQSSPSAYDDKSYSSISDIVDNDQLFEPQSTMFCGALCDIINFGNTNNKGTKKHNGMLRDMINFGNTKKKGSEKDNLKKLKKAATKRSSIGSGFDSYSIRPTHITKDDNESQFVPPSKIYTNSYSGDENDSENCVDENDYSVISDDDKSRLDDYSVTTERFSNTTELKAKEKGAIRMLV